MTKQHFLVIDEELTKLQLLEASSSEFNVTRNYLDWLTALPWGDYSDENFDVHRAQEILDEDHYGLSDSYIVVIEVPQEKYQPMSFFSSLQLGRGHAGDPASALLELLDPEQNMNFLDHYLDIPIDLSKVLFVCTANVIEMIPNPLLDRMEVIAIAGYITDEKKHIARDYLEKSTREACGIKPEQVEVTDSALLELIENYCREAGVKIFRNKSRRFTVRLLFNLFAKGFSMNPLPLQVFNLKLKNQANYLKQNQLKLLVILKTMRKIQMVM
ncbi:hypothetical protein HPP92_016721 [Vanilla planifolia]|uniref:Lon protease n=1 Tax=Vanilla planifolia TaxID=51239 RepID=A0A835QFC0_VANPL|nr:hypothetical protein HPP92_016721 [Vanilla planifolia]